MALERSAFIVVGIPTLSPQCDSTHIWGSLLTQPTSVSKDSRMWGVGSLQGLREQRTFLLGHRGSAWNKRIRLLGALPQPLCTLF